MKRYGHTWVRDNGGDWSTVIDDKFHLITWLFGESCHQMNIMIKGGAKEDAQICIDCVDTRDGAMQTMLKWVADYKEAGFISAEEQIRRSYIRYPTLYSYRHQVLNHLFFVIGNGYGWTDGQLTTGDLVLDPWDDDEERERRKKERAERRAEMRGDPVQDLLDRLTETEKKEAETSEAMKSIREMAEGWKKRDAEREALEDAPRPFEDDGRLLDFYPVCEYSRIMNVPDNVTDDWLALAIEAGEMLLERQVPDNERKRERGWRSDTNKEKVASVMPRLYRMRWTRIYGEPCECPEVRGAYLTSPRICGSCNRKIMDPEDLGPEPPKDGKKGWFVAEIEGGKVNLR